MSKVDHTLTGTQKRRIRVRSKLHGTAERPRVTVFRSNAHTYLQAINDDTGVTLASATEKGLVEKSAKNIRAAAVAKTFAENMKKVGLKAAVFDRGSYKYHGRVKAVAEALREAGIHV